DLQGNIGFQRGDQLAEILGGGRHHRPVDLDEHVIGLDARLLGGSARLYLDDQDANARRQVQVLRDAGADRLDVDAQAQLGVRFAADDHSFADHDFFQGQLGVAEGVRVELLLLVGPQFLQFQEQLLEIFYIFDL